MQEPIWTDRPPTDGLPPALDLKRTGTAPTTGICLSLRPIGCEVHFWRGHTRPCLGPILCEACHDGQSRRWKGYIALYDPLSRHVWIHEFTTNAYAGLSEALDNFRDLRGHWIKFKRSRPTPNAPLVSEVHSKKEPSETIPPEPDIKKILNRIWDTSETIAEDVKASDHTQERVAHVSRLTTPPQNDTRRNGEPVTA